jgi:hypothetical protein
VIGATDAKLTGPVLTWDGNSVTYEAIGTVPTALIAALYPRCHKHWTEREDRRLLKLIRRSRRRWPMSRIAMKLGRPVGGCRKRLAWLFDHPPVASLRCRPWRAVCRRVWRGWERLVDKSPPRAAERERDGE